MKFFLIIGLTTLFSGTTVFINNLPKGNEKMLILQNVNQNVKQQENQEKLNEQKQEELEELQKKVEINNQKGIKMVLFQ